MSDEKGVPVGFESSVRPEDPVRSTPREQVTVNSGDSGTDTGDQYDLEPIRVGGPLW